MLALLQNWSLFNGLSIKYCYHPIQSRDHYSFRYLCTSSITTPQVKKRVRSFRRAGPRTSSFVYPHNHWNHTNNLHASSSKPLTIWGRIGSLPVNILIDTGSSLTLINEYLFRQLPPSLTAHRRRPPSLTLRLANNSPLSILWTLALPITYKRTTRWHTVHIVRDLWRPCIIGNSFIRRHNLQINGGNKQFASLIPIHDSPLLKRSFLNQPNINHSFQHSAQSFQLQIQTCSLFPSIQKLLFSIHPRHIFQRLSPKKLYIYNYQISLSRYCRIDNNALYPTSYDRFPKSLHVLLVVPRSSNITSTLSPVPNLVIPHRTGMHQLAVK